MNAPRLIRGMSWLVLLLAVEGRASIAAAAEHAACTPPHGSAALTRPAGPRADVPLPGSGVTGASMSEKAAPHERTAAPRRLQLFRTGRLDAIVLRPHRHTPEPRQHLIRAGLLAARLGTPPPHHPRSCRGSVVSRDAPLPVSKTAGGTE